MQIGGEAGVRQRLNVYCPELLTRRDAHRTMVEELDRDACFAQFLCHGGHRLRLELSDGVGVECHVAVCDRGGEGKGTGFEAVAHHHAMPAKELSLATNADRTRADTTHICTHAVEEVSEGDHLRLRRGIDNRRVTLRKGCCHHQVLGAGVRGVVEIHIGADQTRRDGPMPTVFLRNLRPQLLEAVHVHRNRACAEFAATRLGRTHLTCAGQQRSGDEERRPHPLHEFHGRLRACEGAGADGDTMMREVEFHRRAEVPQEFRHRMYICNVRYIFQRTLVLGEQAGCHHRQRGVFRAPNRYVAA